MREIIVAPKAPKAVGPYSQAVRAGGFIFTAGQLGLVPETGRLAGEKAAVQTRQALENIKAVLEAAGSGLDRIVKTTLFVVDLNDFTAVNSVYAEFFPDRPPARSTVQVAALPLGGRVEIESIALAGEH